MIFDSHAHYDDEAFDMDRDEVLMDVNKRGIAYIMNAGASINSSKRAVELAKKYDFVYAAVGIHPEDANEYSREAAGVLKELSKYHKVKAIGEIGLDYYYEGYDEEAQKKAFKGQIELALSLDLPIVVHDREAHGDTFNIIKSYIKDGLKGVLHCYSGSAEMAKEYVKLGFYIGFTGVITFKNAKKSVDVLREMPLERIVIETDCPYLAPVPFRGKRNDSRYLKYVVDKGAQTLGIGTEEFEEATYKNAKTLFGI